jgi:hypothetical protein
VTAEYQLGDDELELLTEVVRGLDECEALAAVIARDGYTSTGVAGQLRAHPCLAELRATRLVVAKLLAQIGLPADGEDVALTPLQRRSKVGNDAKWGAHRELEAHRRATGR